MSGQLDLDGGETLDPRLERAAKALWHRDSRRSHPDGNYPSPKAAQDARDAVWPRVKGEYVKAAGVAVAAYEGRT